jgi:aryl-alcohol dehydrogenase-like predicted oxidoreductase
VERDGGVVGGLNAEHIAKECELSLERLQVDTIDLFYAHKPDEHGVPLEETVAAFAALIEQVRRSDEASILVMIVLSLC